MISLLPIILLFGLVYGCARTSDSGTVTTTVATVTTTTAGTATTTTSTNCNSCSPAQLTLSAEPGGGPQSHAPDPPTVGTLNGCATAMLTCTPQAGVAQSLMTFNDGIGGPLPGNPAMATLVCNAQGQYQLQDLMGPMVTAVYCLG